MRLRASWRPRNPDSSVPLASTTCAAPAAPAYAYQTTTDGGTCAYADRIYRVDGACPGTVHVGKPGACSPTTQPTYAFFAIGSEVAPSTFVSGSVGEQ